MYDFLIYDFDGTLSDSFPIFTEAYVELARRHGITADYDTSYAWIKKSGRFAMKQYDFGVSLEEAWAEFKELRHELGRRKQQLFPHAEEILQYAISQNKTNFLYTHTGKFVYEMLDKMKIQDCFEFVLDGSYDFPSKPAPDGLQFLCEKFRIDKSRALMIGDRDMDIDAAHAAGIDACLIDTGNFYPNLEAEYRIHNLLELKEIMM